MSLIEGVGDEVTLVFAALLVILVGMFAWLSTHTSDIPFFSVLLVELTRRRERSPSPNSSTPEDSSTATTSSTPDTESQATASTDPSTPSHTEDDSQGDVTPAELPPESETAPANEEVIPSSSSDVETVRRRRLEFLSKQVNESERQPPVLVTQQEASVPVEDPPSSSRVGTPPCSVDPHSRQSETGEELNLEDGNIRVKLKYLNETLRLVQSSPSETIGEFKRTHFASELASNKLVRLIFNGQCLQNDGSTLQSYNIHDNCTVHCLVTEARQAAEAPPSDDVGNINLSIFMLPAFGLLLAVIWYFRFVYRQYFSAMSTLSLIGITFLFSVFVFSTYTTRQNRDEHQHHQRTREA